MNTAIVWILVLCGGAIVMALVLWFANRKNRTSFENKETEALWAAQEALAKIKKEESGKKNGEKKEKSKK